MAVLGIDLALKNIAIVKLEGDRPTVLFRTAKGPTKDLGASLKFMQTEMVPIFMQHQGLPVAIDWSPYEVLMRTNRLTVIHKAFLAGYLYRALLSHGSRPVCISPNAIRRCLGVKRNTPKEKVWTMFLRRSGISSGNMNSHERDALILAWVLDQHLPLVGRGPDYGLL